MENRVTGLRPSAHTRLAKRAQTGAKIALWGAAGLTIGILVLIIGYILVRGFVSDNTREYPVIAKGAASAGGTSVLVSSAVRLSEISLEDVDLIFRGELSNWGDLSGQDLAVTIVDSNNASAALRILAASGGGIATMPADSLPERLPSGVKRLVIRSISIVASPEVLSLKNGRRISVVKDADLPALLSGSISNWSRIGGPDLPVTVVAMGVERWERRQLEDLLFKGAWTLPARALVAHTPAQMIETVLGTPGAVGFLSYSEASKAADSILRIGRREVSRNLTLAFVLEEPKRAGRVGGISTIILNTIFMIILTLAFTTPIGIAAAVYLTEYSRQGRLIDVIRFGTETLAGVPSIIFGLFGYLVFVNSLRLGIGLLSGTLTIAIMILPTIVRTSEEAIKSIPQGLREGSLALGATKWQTNIRVVIPSAAPGILTGVILAVGRAVGETAALIFTMGSDYRLVEGLRSSARVLSVHLYFLVKEGISFDRAFATGTILVIVILLVNLTTTRLIGRMNLMRIPHGSAGG